MKIYMKLLLVGLSMFNVLFVGAACSTDSTAKGGFGEEGLRFPIELTKSIIKNIDWELTGTFIANGFEMRGHPYKIGFIDHPFGAGKPNKYMWHVWGENTSTKNLTVLAIKEGDDQPIPVLYKPGTTESKILSLELGGENNGADAHRPSVMGLPTSGKWALICFIDEEHFGNIVIEVH